MHIESISIGDNRPADVNVIIEVSVGGQPIKYKLDKNAGTPRRVIAGAIGRAGSA